MYIALAALGGLLDKDHSQSVDILSQNTVCKVQAQINSRTVLTRCLSQ